MKHPTLKQLQKMDAREYGCIMGKQAYLKHVDNEIESAVRFANASASNKKTLEYLESSGRG